MSRSAVIALVAMVVLGGIFFATQKKEVSVGVQLLDAPDFSSADISKIEITGKKPATLIKNDEQWSLETKGEGAQKVVLVSADTDKVEALLSEATKVRSNFMVSDRKDTHEGYELTESTATSVIFSNDKDNVLSLLAGRAAKNGGIYMREKNDDRVFAVRSRLGALLNKDVNDWRGRAIWDLKAQTIAKVIVKPVGGSPYSIAVAGTEQAPSYQLGEDLKIPEGFRFGQEEAKRLVSALPNLKANAFYDGKAEAEETGFKGDHATIIVERKEGKSSKLHIGSQNDKKQRYVEVEGNPQLFLIQASVLQQYLGDVNSVRSMKMVDFDEAQVTQIEITEGGKKTLLKKNDSGWTVVSPKKLPQGFQFDPASVERQLRSIKNTQADAYIAAAPAPEHGLKRPSLKVTLSQGTGKPVVLSFGAETDAGGNKVFVHSPIDGGVYLARAFQKTRFQKGVELFKKFEAPKGDFSQAQGFNSLPPDIRKSLEEQMRKQQQLR
jgi:hypothetical protein